MDFQIPPLPGNLHCLDRKQGASFAQRVLRKLDSDHPALVTRHAALRWAAEEYSAVHASRPETEDVFFEGLLSALGGAESTLKARIAKVANLRSTASQCAAKAERERDRMLVSAASKRAEAELIEGRAAREYERLIAYAQQQEGIALECEAWTMADGRFA
jgi:hypothetical protein